MLPERIRIQVEDALNARIDEVSRVGGGCISPAGRVETSRGDRFFLKWSDGSAPEGLFIAEAESLYWLESTGTVRVPAVIHTGAEWLLLEWLEPGRKSDAMMAELGRRLADLHTPRESWSSPRPMNFIGSLPQSNQPARDWPSFWRERRLRPQLELACRSGHFSDAHRRAFDALFDRLAELLAPGDEEGPSLLHGDLWNGNVHAMATGEAALVDPSCYVGHREVDLSMADLFGGFGTAFRAAYEDAWPLLPGYHEQRRPIYQLYYLLVHVNLFGAGYVAQTLDTLRSVQ